MASHRSVINIYNKGPYFGDGLNFSRKSVRNLFIFTTSHLEMSFADKIGKRSYQYTSKSTLKPFTHLLRFADEIMSARKALQCKQFEIGRISDETLADSLKQESLIRVLGCFDNTGENLKASQKKEAAKECNCTLGEVENVLGRFRWIKEARKKMDKLKAEGKPMPQNMIEIQKLMGSTATDFARSN
ncbi:hypothetical protein MKW92_043943 [Papaver armeniacum]|nr:hypothetical protein MKW92_043943 [Papaver armeniacum]